MKLLIALGKAVLVVVLCIVFFLGLLFIIGAIISGPDWVGPVVGLGCLIGLFTAIFYETD
jgi:hypothetical protein